MNDTKTREASEAAPAPITRSWRVPLAVFLVGALVLGVAAWLGQNRSRGDGRPVGARPEAQKPMSPARSPAHARIYRVFEEVPADGDVVLDIQLGEAICTADCPAVDRKYTYDGDPVAVYDRMKARFAQASWKAAFYNCDCEREDIASGQQGRAGIWCKEDLFVSLTVLTTGPRIMQYLVSAGGVVNGTC